ncbi:MAG TPA: DUF2442 domain-containing protein [Elusimicrobia bacterium]|nr:DUF2442 domain-containing protein [Elusimicrobiota bacterium]
MKSRARGANTSAAEVQGITAQGIWIYVQGSEYFLNHQDYPWFKGVSVESIFNMVLLHGHHLHWPDLDVDLELESLRSPEKYPLKSAVLHAAVAEKPRAYRKGRSRPVRA